ncbi:bacteriophage N4 receptor, outer membrane subunit [Pigmentiphaga humi]|uniref:Bacteriophage N4 receptor, outer membrane subunit n=1 Tax=Pigmentiphaga humi TaxID=2478468 RepID=A0A3P4AZ64_9BURK|nr:tetratricopeptide repeat protein [Pigmentiphaga humi]VCU68851.1 bacteriophage N4 receptor, outer membrane subunit [Pigmentiphaga humi]
MLFNVHRWKQAVAGMGLAAAMSAAWAQSGAPSSSDELLVPGLNLSPLGGRAVVPKTLPDVDLSAEVLFQILASEIAAQRGAFTPAAGTSVELARATGDPRLARRAVEFSLAGGDLVRALEAAQIWAELDPSDVEARQTALSLAAAAGRVDGMGPALRARIAAAPDKAIAIVEARRVVARLEDRRRALGILDEALADVRTMPEAHIALARTAGAAGDNARALREAEAALQAQPDSETAAMLALQIGIESDPERAVARARAFVATHAEARSLRVLLARALASVKDFDGARSELEAMARANPEDFEIIYMQGVLAYQSERLDDADEYLRRYLDIHEQRSASAGAAPLPEADNALFLRVQIAEDQRRYDDAFDLLDKVDDPNAALAARLRQAVLRGKQGRVDDARKIISILDPRSTREGAQVALTEAQILRSADRRDEAVKVLEAATERYPDTPELMYDLAMLYEQQNRIEDMEKQLRQVIAVKPDHAHAYNALGYSLADRNVRLAEAKRLVERAVNLSPDDPFIIDSMGWVYYRMGDHARALSYLERAYKLRPDAEIGVHLGEVLWASGQQQRARQLWREVQAKDPGNGLLRGTLARLDVTL